MIPLLERSKVPLRKLYTIYIPQAHSVFDTRLNYVLNDIESEVLGGPEPLQNCVFPQNEASLIPPVVLRIPRDTTGPTSVLD